MNKCLIIILSSLSFGALAEEESIDCNNAMTTIEINQCAAIELESAQVKLDKYLSTSFEHNSHDPELIAAIKLAQQDWQAYCPLTVIRFIRNGVMELFVELWRYRAKLS